jgi:hypothetical protein
VKPEIEEDPPSLRLADKVELILEDVFDRRTFFITSI